MEANSVMDNARRIARSLEVERINENARIASLSAKRRDMWLVNNLIDGEREPLTAEQKKQVDDFWRPYEFAYQNDYHLQEMFTAISGRFDPSYFGFGMQRYLMVRFWNHESFKYIGEKNFTPLFFPEAKMPETVVYNSCGLCYGKDRKLLSKQELVDKILAAANEHCSSELIIKPSGGGEGKGISFIDANTTPDEIEHLVSMFGSDYICQKVVKNHESFSAPYSASLNTMRMHTIVWKERVYYAGAVLRMGVNKRVDNWSQGGLACGILPDGKLQPYAFTEHGELFYRHPTTGFVFRGHSLYKYQEAIDFVIKLHESIAQQKYVSWDVTVDDEGELMLIELNSPGSHELMQMAGYNGYLNQELAKEIFDEYLIKRFFYNKAIFDWNYREFNDHISLREYCGMDSRIVVPEEINGKPVSLVYSKAVLNQNVECAYVPHSVSLAKDAFPYLPNERIIRFSDSSSGQDLC